MVGEHAKSWSAQFVHRIKLLWFWKSTGTALFMAVFFYLYFLVLNHPMAAVHTMPITALDKWIGFWSPAFFPYASLWLYTSLVPALQPNGWRLLGYGVGIGAVCLTGLAIFAAFPTAVPFTAMDWFNDPSRSVLQQLDAAGNACPSLHVAAALFSALNLRKLLQEMACPPWVAAVNWVWCAVIVYSTMAIKQHVMWDVVAGVALALCIHALYAPFERRIRSDLTKEMT
jgi:membrane-associated phospholipid phosphatase